MSYTGEDLKRVLQTLTIQPPADSTLSGTTTANGSATITGSNTKFLSQVNIGDRLALSSSPGTYATVISIASDTSLMVNTLLGNGTTQTISVKRRALRVTDSTGAVTLFQIKDDGSVDFAGAETHTGPVTFNSQVTLHVGAAVASAGSLMLGTDGNIFTITGTTTINHIPSYHNHVFLVFAGALTVTHNAGSPPGGFAPILLQGSTNLTTAANTVLELIYDGTNWQEVSRKTAA